MISVLIAEDDLLLVKMYRINLEHEGFAVQIATDGEQAVAAMDASSPDILLLDLLMPKMDGFAVLEHIRAKGYDFPVIVLSNLVQEINMDKMKHYDFKDYFIKSDMDLPMLIERVKGLVRKPAQESVIA